MIVQLLFNREVVGEYTTIANASRATGVNAAHISSCITRNRTTAGGYYWEKRYE